MSEEVVRGKQVTIRFEAKRCIHSRHCVLDRPDVFVPNVEGEWIHPDRATAAEALELAHNCPSGAIQCEASNGSVMEHAPRVNTVRVRENGPLAIRAPITLGGQQQGYRLTLCRCGASANKPYCDNSHLNLGFTAAGEPPAVNSQALAARDGVLAIEATTNGPLHLVGNVEIVTGTGKTINRVTDAWLCRCGQSKNKPYCDGSHRAAGFRSDK
jgi:CDGSH-type Zn-finger protein/uncharacterized Fe-S cluster protein YjdI